MKQSDPEKLLKSSICIFRCQKYVKKGYMEMGEHLYQVALFYTTAVADFISSFSISYLWLF